MRKQLPLLVLLLLPLLAWAQTVTVPKNVYFADVHLKISDGAQQEIQKKVDALHRNQTYFKIKVDLANAYFPIIERVFKQEGVPDDFKYLALQESGLIGDAVSTSNAVGYWQFKKEAAMDFNLRMDNVVDERRHIIEASRGAALYFKRSNKNYDNWFTSLLSYYLGYSGVKTYSSPSDKGSKKMDVSEKSHPYVLTFLAHKIAYDNFVGREKPVVSLKELRATPGQSLSDIALATKTDFAELEKYNKWLLGSSIPSDKDYYVMVPVRQGSDVTLVASSAKEETPTPIAKPATTAQQNAAAAVVKRNGLNALIARPNDTKDKLALQAGISTRKFLKYNDLHNFDEIVPGAAYYIEQKKVNADAEYHTVQAGETMQLISQHYGIRLNYLRYKNRMGRNEVPVPGRVLWLQKRRPAATPVEVKDANAKQSIAAAQAAPSYNKPEGTAIKATATTEPEAPKENIFKRFINSFKKNRQEGTTAESAPVAQEQPAKTPVAERKTTVTETAAATKEPVAEKETVPVQETATGVEATQKKPAKALYPAKDNLVIKPKDETQPAAKQEPAPAQKQEAQPAVKNAPQETAVTKPVETPATASKAVEAEQENEVETILQQEPEKEEIATTANVPAQQSVAAPKPAAQPVASTQEAAQEEQPAVKSAKHVVSKGETLYAISKMYQVTVAELTAWNKLTDSSLKLGQELAISEPFDFKPEAEVAPAPAPKPEQPAKPAVTYHTVVAGETLYQISKQYSVSLENLRNWNNLLDNNIKLGQELRVAAPTEAEPETTPAAEVKKETAPATTGNAYHTVAAGESLYQISRKYGVTIKDIMDWNKKADFNVAPGEKLLIKRN